MSVINLASLDKEQFVARFGGLYECSPWIAESAWESLQKEETVAVDELRSQLQGIVNDASREQKLALLNAHPELAGKAAMDGELTVESTEEQASARLDLCSKAEFDQFQTLNTQYNEKFGFPFILAVRGRNRAEILTAFSQRVNNEASEEFNTAIEQVHQIASMRLSALENTVSG